MKLSTIIPVLNEAENIAKLLQRLQSVQGVEAMEIIVVDGGSEDETKEVAERAGARVICSPQRGRAAQMNFGASEARGEILYFVHADTLPPLTFQQDIKQALADGYPAGCFRYQFNSNHPLLKINAYFTRFNKLWCRGGDQSLYIKRPVFDALNGFCNDYLIMEDFEFIIRLQKNYSFRIIPNNMIVSARKYETNSYLRVQIANFVVFNMFRLGYSQQKMANAYKRLLNYR